MLRNPFGTVSEYQPPDVDLTMLAGVESRFSRLSSDGAAGMVAGCMHMLSRIMVS